MGRMAAPALSVVIPTHRRPAILSACLEHLERQTVRDRIDVIVVSDGHDPATIAAVKEREWNIPVRFFEIPKSQQGTARNRGVKEAAGEVILFIGDDIFLAPDACEAHLAAHGSHANVAVLGFTEWDPAVGVTPVMRWLDDTGWQFGYGFLEPYRGRTVPEERQHSFTYTSHLSVPADVAKRTPFLEDLTEYGWEDMVYGMHLRDAGVRLFYEPSARALHHHRLDLADSLRRMRAIGRAGVALKKRDPTLDLLPAGKALAKYRFLALLPTMRGKHAKALLEGMTGDH
jgi:GT2 family glycosyltransferase